MQLSLQIQSGDIESTFRTFLMDVSFQGKLSRSFFSSRKSFHASFESIDASKFNAGRYYKWFASIVQLIYAFSIPAVIVVFQEANVWTLLYAKLCKLQFKNAPVL